MKTYLQLLKFPPLLMAVLLQIVPLCRTALVNPGTFQSSFSIIFKWVAATGMTLGAVDAVSGASAAISSLRVREGATIVAQSLTPSFAAGADNISMQIMVSNPGSDHEQDYWDCTPLPDGFTINTAVGGDGFITLIPGQTTVAGVYEVVLKAGNQNYGFVTANATITVTNTSSGSPPTITSPPTSQTVNSGSTASLTVVANDNGSPPLTYQWRKNQNNIGPPGSSATLSFDPVTTDDEGSYDVIVTSPGGSVTSAPPAVLTVVQTVTPPTIETGPMDQTAYIGGGAEFNVTASSSVPVTYQWRKGGVNLGTDSATLSISPVTVDSAGDYDVVVSNSAGSATSTPVATLTVIQPEAMQLEMPPGQASSGPRTVSWQGIAGKSYTVERRDNFAPDVWRDLGTTNVTVSGTVEMTDETAANTNIRFYRIRTD